MKAPKKEKAKAEGPWRVGGARKHFFPGDSLDRLPKLNKMYREAGMKEINASFALREAVVEWIEARIREVKKALNGELHAKRRNRSK
jgi:hypothetical protein